MNPVLFMCWVLVLVMVKAISFASLDHQLVSAAENGVMNKKCIDKERHALLDFKSHILRDPEGYLSTWGAEEGDCCKWDGVTCNTETGHIQELDLRASGFEGEISPLFNLTYLSYLDLSWNSFNGIIPRSIGSLTELRFLDLSGNSFYGTIPSEFGNLTNLEELSLRGHFGSLAVENLDWLSRMSQLQSLNMDGISLAKQNNWVNLILSLQKLSHLSLSDCDISQVTHPYSSSPSVNSSSSNIVSLVLEKNNLNSSMYHWLFPLTSNSLLILDLSGNMLDGIPTYLGNLCNLTSLYIYNNSVAVNFSDFMNNLSGCTSITLLELDASDNQITGSLSDDIQNFSSLETLDLSSNSLRGVPSEAHMANLSNVQEIDLSSCKLLGPHFPKWIQALRNLTRLNIANTMLSDTLPIGFWNMWPSQLNYLNLSSNNTAGKVPDLISNFNQEFSRIDLSSNDFYGPIPNVPSTLDSLDLSRNKFSGGIFFLCQIVDGFLTYLDLSNNSLTGQIPDCLWHFKKLKLLNLGHNYLSGKLPASIESMIELEGLYLNNNVLSGELPVSLKNCTKLTFLDLGTNMFSGILPHWIGKNLSLLYVIILRENNFFGSISIHLCELVNLQILDLSVNNLNGSIPSCVSNLTAMVRDGFSYKQKVHIYKWRNSFSDGIIYNRESEYVNSAMIKWQGSVREFSRTLGLLKIIDLSSNDC